MPQAQGSRHIGKKKYTQSNIIIPSQGQHRWTVIYQCFKTAAFCTHKIGGQIQNTPRSQLHTAVSCLGKQIKSKDLLLGYLEVHWGLWSVGLSCSQLIQTHAGAWILWVWVLCEPSHPIPPAVTATLTQVTPLAKSPGLQSNHLQGSETSLAQIRTLLPIAMPLILRP